MDVLIGGKSPIDLKRLGIKDEQTAKKFVESYGFNLDRVDDQKFVHMTIVEALSFVEKVLMPKEWGQGKKPPNEILLCSDVVDLLLWASMGKEDGKRGLLSLWSCAILRVVHTIAHIHGVQRHADIDEARNQIISKFRKALFRSDKGRLMLGNSKSFVELEKVEWKADKARASIILKLLHKPANVAETIYDFIGVRIVTKNYPDVMQVVKILGEQFLISFPNANPKRARNSLIDLEDFREKVTELKNQLDSKEISPEEFVELVSDIQFDDRNSKKRANPHSASSYRSIQMTCRQLIHFKDPAMRWLDKSYHYLKKSNLSNTKNEILLDTLDFVKSWYESLGIVEDLKVFFPFEVQVFDKETRQNIEMSEANHIFYKKAQVRTARKRILSEVISHHKSR
jgi:uncharacterized protein (TIGR04562 family)